ncbi:MAG TPA: RluA family pseudouridine synthase [Patescibacteria group bacterium]|nr:RluA family pseudouridine synthase [Patescibacteria group bacterium]
MKAIFEDDDLIVVDKPAGVTVNRSETTKSDTLQDWLDNRFVNPNDKSEFSQRSGIVHRLDKETSGIMVVAKNASSFEKLKNQFKERQTKKTYIALAHGKLKTTEGEINAPVGRLPWNRMRFGVLAGGREAVTKYRVIKNLEINGELMTLLEVEPKTGRTHQIRVHLKHIGHPIFADPLYSGRKVSIADRVKLPRVFLHAKKLEFLHPTTGERMSFESELPKELKDLIL